MNSREKSQLHTRLQAWKEVWLPGMLPGDSRGGLHFSNNNREFPGGPVVGTPDFHRRGHRVTLVRELRSHIQAAWCSQKKKKKKLRFRFPHSLEQWFLANRDVALQGPFDNI